MVLAEFERDLLSLPEADRVHLIEVLWESLRPDGFADHLEKWFEEGERRLDAIDVGESPLVESKQVFDDVRTRLRS